jgi:hypothetical protein
MREKEREREREREREEERREKNKNNPQNKSIHSNIDDNKMCNLSVVKNMNAAAIYGQYVLVCAQREIFQQATQTEI